MTTEKMTITKAIALSKDLEQQIINQSALSDSFMINYYFGFNQYIGSRTLEQHEELVKSNFDKLNALIVRWKAVTAARVQANATTKVAIPKWFTLSEVVNGKVPSETDTEEITIAEAITRKKMFKTVMFQLGSNLQRIMTNDMNKKAKFEDVAETRVQESMQRQFPETSQRQYSKDAMTEALAKEREINKVLVSDPMKVLDTDSINKYMEMIRTYIKEIDTILSVVNASTEITVEY